MKRYSGFTLVEIIVVVAIVIILAAISWSVFQPAKDRAQQTSCAGNLRNLYVAITMYRQDNDGADHGTAAEMGFPHPWVAVNMVKPLPKCAAAPSDVFNAKYPYWLIANPQPGWREYVEREGNAAYMIADLNHNPRNQPLTSSFGTYRAIAINLGGTLKTFVRKGGWESLNGGFWNP